MSKQHTRRWRIGAVAAAVVVVGTAAGVVALTGNRHSVPPGPGPAGTRAPSGSVSHTTAAATDTVQVLAALLAERGASAATPVLVYARLCTTSEDAPPDLSTCTAPALSAAEQAEITRLAAPALVRFADVMDASPMIVLGPPEITGDAATASYGVFCGPLCGQGGTLHFQREGSNWRYDGRSETGWIS